MISSQFCLVVCARWETACIVEWLLYHRSIGFDHVYLYCNDDDPRELHERVLPFSTGPSPFVTFLHYPVQGEQRSMYRHFLKNHRHAAEWIMFLDVDEFLCLRGVDNITHFTAALPNEWDAVYFNWLYFGTSGFIERPEGSVLLQYTRREKAVNPYTKILIRSARIPSSDFSTAIWHDWHEALGPGLRGFNVLGHPMHGYYDNFPDDAWRYLYSDDVMRKIIDMGQVFHFAMKSERDHLLRMERGMGGDFHRQGAWNELYRAGKLEAFLELTNAVEDTYLRDYWSRYLARVDETFINTGEDQK